MRVGIPKALLYCRYHPFIESFFCELGSEIILSEDTNKTILDEGVKYCVDEACLPVKVFHGHVASIKDKCDIVVVPRIMRLKKREFICPKFCGLPEMIINSIPHMPEVTTIPIYADSPDNFLRSIVGIGNMITKNKGKIKKAYNIALTEQRKHRTGIMDKGYKINIALTGHPYNIYDTYVNMDIVKKLNKLGIGVITSECISEELINSNVGQLYKKPFWTFARENYGFSTYACENHFVDGIIYISSFACGIDSVVTELIKDSTGDFPFLTLKIDEHTGDAGLDTRIEAFFDMLERRC